MKKLIKLILFVSFFLVSYLVILFILRRVDPQPDWAELDIPKVAIPGENLVFTVYYHDIQAPSQLFTALVYRDENDVFCGQKHYTDSIPIVYGEGELQQSLDFDPPDSAENVTISLSLHELPEKDGVSIYKCKRIGKPFRSGRIYLSRDASLPKETDLSYMDVFEKGYGEGYWKDKRGDPTIIGWLITLLYLFASVIAFVLMRRAIVINPDIKYKWFWFGAIVLVFLLGINKQLDLQMLMADFARFYAKVSGIFAYRKPYQQKIISLLAASGVSVFAYMIHRLWKAPKRTWVTLIGFCVLFSFPLIRLVSLHNLEAWLYYSVSFIRVVDIIEITGIVIVFTAILKQYTVVKNALAYKTGRDNHG